MIWSSSRPSDRLHWLLSLCLATSVAVVGCQRYAAVTIERPPPALRAAPSPPTGAPATTALAAAAPTTIRVGAWNIEHFGSPGSRGGVGHDVAQDMDKLADAITRAELGVLAVEEVYATEKTDDGTWTSEVLDELIPELDTRLPTGSTYGWDYLLFENAGSNDTSQLCGVLWNWNVVDEVTWWRIPVAGGKLNNRTLWDRRPHAVKFSTGTNRTDFVLVPLHMKAGDFATHRGKEAQQLADKLDSLRSALADRDIALLGDTNCGSGSEPAVTTFEAAGLKDLNGGMVATTPWGQPLDRVVAASNPTENKEFAGSFVVFDGDDMVPVLSKSDFRKWCSDHFMIYTTVNIMPDDD